MKFILEFTDADDSRLKAAFAERIESDTPIPAPAVGDTVLVGNRHLTVVTRLFSYWDDGMCHIQCFCREANEGDLRRKCQATK